MEGKYELTIKQLINENKVVLDTFLWDTAKIGFQYTDHLVEKLEYKCCINILPGCCHNPDIGASCVEVAGPGNVGDWRPDSMTSMDDIYSKSINGAATRK